MKPHWRAFGLAAAVAVVGGAGCGRAKATPAAQESESSLPVVRAESEGQLLTWIDDKGDFHVETRVADVPMMGRDTVRVVDPTKEAAPNDPHVFVVDLRQARPDGTYPVRPISRVEFEGIAVARRERTGPTLASASAPLPSAPPPSPSAASAAGQGASQARPVVIIYGAEWCGACHEAARYLRHKGIAYVEKDIEKDSAAAMEMQEKLIKEGLSGGSIPVLDVRGKVMVGFNPSAIDAALGEPM